MPEEPAAHLTKKGVRVITTPVEENMLSDFTGFLADIFSEFNDRLTDTRIKSIVITDIEGEIKAEFDLDQKIIINQVITLTLIE